jgi:styrene monooxygenase A-like protein
MHILIVGAGQGGLQLALSLLTHGIDVTLTTDRGPDEVRAGHIMSTQAMFGPALRLERDYDLDLWSDRTSRIDHLAMAVAGGEPAPVIKWSGHLPDPGAHSIDQRMKFARWMELFAERGGRLVINGVSASDLDGPRQLGRYDLTVIATGRGELGGLFARDAARSPFSTPQRALSVVYVHGMAPDADHPTSRVVRCTLLPGVGELFTIPAVTADGPCDILFFEGIPGGPLDVFDDVRRDPHAHLTRTLDLMAQFVPWEHERCRQVTVVDAKANLAGRYAPTVRAPIATLPGGGLVLGMGDVVVSNDPITGQGANNAARAAAIYTDSIVTLAEAGLPPDRAWMQRTFDRYWDYVGPVTDWTNLMLGPPPPHLLGLVAAAAHDNRIADRIAGAFNDPRDIDWILDPRHAENYLERMGGSGQTGA